MVAPATPPSNAELSSSWSEPETAIPSTKHRTTIPSVTSGPAIATRNSTPAESVSRPSLATPPNIQRSMPSIGIPLRIATNAWPSSWSRIDRKKSSALTVARTKAFVPGATSP